MAIDKVVRIVVSGSIGGSVTWNNAFHVATDTAGIGPGLNCADLAQNFGNGLIVNPSGYGGDYGLWRKNVGASIVFNSVTAQRVYPDALDAGVFGCGGVVGLDNGGTWPTGITIWPNLPAPCAGITTWKTARAGRSGRGRTYWAGLLYGTSMTTAECIAPSTYARARLNALAGALYPIINVGGPSAIAGDWYLVLVSRKLAGATPPIDLAGVFPVIGYSNPNYWATMGSRRGGHGI